MVNENTPSAREARVADQDVKALIARIMAEARQHSSARFSSDVYRDEPIIKTGRQMVDYLPDRYREMRAISRWQDDPKGGAGRWLSEAELFYRQGLLMADFEDDCPYHGTFKSYFPTYNAMSDRQLRGYFTWRAQVRRGDVQETSTSFAFVYLYELICGIGIDDPREGFSKIRDFWQAYRAFEPGLDRFARVWLQDYAVYHDLDPRLLRDSKTVAFDRALVELRRASRDTAPQAPVYDGGPKRRRKTAEPTLPLPPDEEREERLLSAIDALSSYGVASSRMMREHRRDLRHVACAVYVRMARYYDAHRKSGIIASLFGEETAMPYTMFGSAVFFSPERHADCEYRLDPIHTYRCQNGFWECTRIHGSRQKSSKLGEIMRACDQRLRVAMGSRHLLKEEEVPKYLAKIIDEEIASWLSWSEAHKPVEIDIDLSRLGAIRDAAAETREALLIDEEREEGAETAPSGRGPSPDRTSAHAGSASEEAAHSAPAPTVEPTGPAAEAPARSPLESMSPSAIGPGMSLTDPAAPATEPKAVAAAPAAGGGIASPAPVPSPAEPEAPRLTPPQRAYVEALLAGDAPAAADAIDRSHMSEDMLVDAVNEALFDLVGDTVIEFGAQGPQIIEDYEEDVRGFLDHE